MDRITDKHLQHMVDSINKATDSPMAPYTRDATTGKLIANVGNYHTSGAYGGIELHRMVNTGGGINVVFNSGYTTKRDLYNHMQAYLSGINQAKE